MKLVFIIGNSAVGKMTVGQELMKITDLRLFHNHMIIEPVLEVFGEFKSKVIARLRDVIFEEFAQSDCVGMIFTYMWAFNRQEDWEYAQHVREIFERVGGEIYYAELVTSQEVRLQRNATENRLKHKLSKRDIDASNQRLLGDDLRYRCESLEGEIPYGNYIKIDNSGLAADVVAQMIKERFVL